jgi:PD-(D/E)XK endonuclease
LKYSEFHGAAPFRAAFFIGLKENFMKITGSSIKHHKLRGEWAELRFMARAAEHGLCINKPWGDSSRYDFALEHAGKFLRMQIKSTTVRRGRSYSCNLCATGNRLYRETEIDFVAAYIVPRNIWYIFPFDVVANSGSVVLSPHLKTSKYGPYQEAWHLLRGEKAPEAAIREAESPDTAADARSPSLVG